MLENDANSFQEDTVCCNSLSNLCFYLLKVKPIVLDISKIFNILFLFPKLRNAFTELNGFKSLNVTGFRYYN